MQALNKLRDLGKNIFFLTNASQNSREDVRDKLKLGGFEPDMDKVTTNNTTTYLTLHRYSRHHTLWQNI